MLSKVIRDQVKDQSKAEVEELILDDWKGTELSQSDKALLESFPNLQFLSMNNCGLRSLNNFPALPKLIKLELNDNKIAGGLDKLLGMKDLMQITLAGNQLRTLDDIAPLAQLTSLVAVDMYRCPVASVPQYRETLFERLHALEILDGTNEEGQEQSLGEEEDQDEDDEDEDEKKFIDDEEGEEDDVEANEEEVGDSDDHSEGEDAEPHKRPKA